MKFIQIQNFNQNPGAIFLMTPRVFSVCGNGHWNEEKSSTIPVNPDWIDQRPIDSFAMEPIVKTALSFDPTWYSENSARLGENCFAITTVTTITSTTTGKDRSPEAWSRNRQPNLTLTGDDTLLANYRVTVIGMMMAFRRNRFRCLYREIHPVCNIAEAMPTGRIVCLQHQLLIL